MEFVEGVSIHKIDVLEKDIQVDGEVVGQLFFEILNQIFTKGVFHCDSHPRNIYLLKNRQPALIGFESVGRLSSIQRSGFEWRLVFIFLRNCWCIIWFTVMIPYF